jgi:hypothetical protein
MKIRTEEEIEVIVPAFSQGRSQGILTEKVLAFLKSKVYFDFSVATAENLIALYTNLGYFGIVELVRSLEGKNIDEIASSTIDFYEGLDQVPFSIENALRVCRIRIGIHALSMTPYMWLWCLAQSLDEILAVQVEAFDEVCAILAKSLSFDMKEISVKSDFFED